MGRGAWRAAVQGVTESGMTEATEHQRMRGALSEVQLGSLDPGKGSTHGPPK